MYLFLIHSLINKKNTFYYKMQEKIPDIIKKYEIEKERIKVKIERRFYKIEKSTKYNPIFSQIDNFNKMDLFAKYS